VIDEEHLRLLSLFHYVSGGLTIAFSMMFIFHVGFMAFIAARPDLFDQGRGKGGEAFPTEVFGFMAVIFGLFILLGICYGISQIISGRFLRQKKHLMFSCVVALPGIIFIPYGTILCTMTLIVLNRPSVKNLYLPPPANAVVVS
jgi:hypothetical protein